MRDLSVLDNASLKKTEYEQDQFNLKRGETWKSVEHFHCLSINCQAGEVWITQSGDFEDHLLHSGEVFQTHIEGLVVMQSLTESAAVSICLD